MPDPSEVGLSGYDRRRNTPGFVKVHQAPYPAIDPTQPSLSAAGKTVLITGGATGIGFSIARNFAAAKASTIVLVARRAPTLKTASAELKKKYPSTQVLTYAVDISDSDAVTALFSSATSDAKNHSVDVVILSAAYIPTLAQSLSIPDSEYRAAFDTNVIGNLGVVRTYLGLPASPSGFAKTVLDVSSEAALLAYPNMSAYGISKHAFSFALRHTQDEHPDVRFHSFHPGAIWTPATEKSGFTREALESILDDEQLPGRFAVWLAGPDAEFLKGRFVMAKWDVEDLVQNKKVFEEDGRR
ncbi:hypothetical protein BCR34DRAFT_81182 [Clohesyomyces aquaticus]|uniref:NAD(P)-binding protein n=1 Tax=Clohesyomyces aquaticus TaxID=1231657 RepID=A0A1Y1YWV7_9PLEO|nr:hypothetical protein BCR34DRAFT_81182 [Clohesyomyces aquaticus]